MNLEIIIENLEDMGRFAGRVAGLVRGGDVVALHGDLGAGKTAFARLLIQSMTSPALIVPSPTFTLVQEYDVTHADITMIRHYDLYRLGDESELVELGWDDVGARHTLTLIEWPERAGRALAHQGGMLSMFLHHDDVNDPDRRRLCLSGDQEWGIRWKKAY